ncbi:MAG: MFS transporter, partial [Gammaproteobacteria bacterium]|nr:MFS transporter [Gammaproteobacteria bacterium]
MVIKYLMNFIRPAPILPQMTNKAEIDRAYKYWRIRIFYSIYVGYVFFYFTRKSFTFVMPEMVQNLGVSYSDLGILSTALYITYGLSKFVSGVLSDRSNPRYFMSIGLILTGILNILFGMSSSIFVLAILCALNGLFQGWGWPPIAKQLTYWYSKNERGTWWSICSTSHNVGGGLIPIIIAYLIAYNFTEISGWRYAMLLPGFTCIAVGLFLLNRLRDVPQSLGLPPIELYRGEKQESRQYTKECSAVRLTAKQILFEKVLNNKFIWVMALSYFFVYVVRTAVNDWTIPYLVELGYDRVLASASIMWFEIGGLIGGLFAGWCSDILFQGRRMPFSVMCAVGMAITLYLFSGLPPADGMHGIKYCYSLAACIGFFVFGPQMLIGLAAVEYVDKKAAGTANGFVGFLGYIGAAVTGYPLGLIIDSS